MIVATGQHVLHCLVVTAQAAVIAAPNGCKVSVQDGHSPDATFLINVGAVTWTTFQTQSFEQQTKDELQQQFTQAEFRDVELVRTTVDYEPIDILLGDEPEVSVLVGTPRDRTVPPDLAQRLDDHLTEQLDRGVVVRVGFIEEQVSEGESTNLYRGGVGGSPGSV